MERVKRKETIQCLTLKEDENDPFSIIPLDLIVEILLKVPTKSVAGLVFVSKKWLSIISGKYFINQYLQARSSPRLLFTVFCTDMTVQFLHSCSQVDPSSDRHRVNIIPYKKKWYHVHALSPPIRGLICRQMDSRVMIGNPTTGQFVTLPRVKTTRRGVLSFFGYDPVNHAYKVLCLTVLRGRHERESQVVAEDHQVYTLGGAQQKWRVVECKHPHLPPSPSVTNKGICLNGVLYYYAWIKNEGALISFDLISDEFSVIKLPEDNQRIVNYAGKLAIAGWITIDGALDMWVLEDASKQEWSKVSIVVPSWRELVGKPYGFRFRGTVSTGELIFSPFSSDKAATFFFISYNLKENKAQKVVVREFGSLSAYLEVYFDHVESPLFCQI